MLTVSVALAATALFGVRQNQNSYLTTLAADTWRCISGMVQQDTGLPYDNSHHGEYTSVSNIGIYLSCICAAREMGLITSAEADCRLGKSLGSVRKLKKWMGFQQSWNSVNTLQPSPSDTWISILDTGNLVAGMTVAGKSTPKYRRWTSKLIDEMEWVKFYDPTSGFLIGGYNTAKGEFNRQWHLELLGSDAQLAVLFAIAKGAMPPEGWSELKRDTESRYGHTYLSPGWQGGGLFMQYISGIWLDQSKSQLGVWAREFASAQMEHAKALGYPVWGWSASNNPDGGYLGWGGIRDDVVTPHACVLAVEYFPEQAVQNLKALEAMGVRSRDQGFYDAVNVKTKKNSGDFLVLDQGMLFLSLANYLHGNTVRKWFSSDTLVKKALSTIPELKP